MLLFFSLLSMLTIRILLLLQPGKSNLKWIVVVRLVVVVLVTYGSSMGTLVPRGVLGMHAFSFDRCTYVRSSKSML